jgi:hypothetical protein
MSFSPWLTVVLCSQNPSTERPPRGPVLSTSADAWEEARHHLGCAEHHWRLEALAPHVQLVPPAPLDLPCPLEPPDRDRPVLLAALQGGATHFLTGDRRHFGRYYGTTVRGQELQSGTVSKGCRAVW